MFVTCTIPILFSEKQRVYFLKLGSFGWPQLVPVGSYLLDSLYEGSGL